VKGKTACRVNVFSCIINNNYKNSLLIKYLYSYLKINRQSITKNAHYSINLGTISKKNLEKIKIALPSLELQQLIVNKLDTIYEENIPNLQKTVDSLKKVKKIIMDNQVKFGDNQVMKLGDVCEVETGKYIKKSDMIKGQYPVYGGGNVSNYINQFNRENKLVIAKDGVSEKCVRYVKGKFFLNHHGWTLKNKSNMINVNYLNQYMLSIQNIIYKCAKGAAQKGINQEKFYNLKIPFPSLQKQKEIVQELEKNDQIIKQLQEAIERNKQLGKDTLENALKSEKRESEKDVIDNLSKVEKIKDPKIDKKYKKLMELNKNIIISNNGNKYDLSVSDDSEDNNEDDDIIIGGDTLDNYYNLNLRKKAKGDKYSDKFDIIQENFNSWISTQNKKSDRYDLKKYLKLKGHKINKYNRVLGLKVI
jgi:type I restriction enzyme S subunit